MSIYKKAAKYQLRFQSVRGLLTVEDLFTLPLTSTRANTPNLNDMAKAVNTLLKASEEESFVEVKSDAAAELQLKLDILKDVIADSLADLSGKKTAREKKAKKEKILTALARKEDDALEDKSPEELKKMLDEL